MLTCNASALEARSSKLCDPALQGRMGAIPILSSPMVNRTLAAGAQIAAAFSAQWNAAPLRCTL